MNIWPKPIPGPHFTMTPVPVYLIQCFRSSLPHPVLQFQSTSSSAAVSVYLIQCSSSILPPPVFYLQPTSSSLQFQSTPIPVYLIQSPIPVYLIQSPIPVFLNQCSSPEDFNFSLISCSLLLFLYFFFFQISRIIII